MAPVLAWFNHKLQELEMQLANASEELRLNRENTKQAEKERHKRIKSMIEGRSANADEEDQPRDSNVSEDLLGMNTDRLLEEQFIKE